jgi:hypothetical protein
MHGKEQIPGCRERLNVSLSHQKCAAMVHQDRLREISEVRKKQSKEKEELKGSSAFARYRWAWGLP